MLVTGCFWPNWEPEMTNMIYFSLFSVWSISLYTLKSFGYFLMLLLGIIVHLVGWNPNSQNCSNSAFLFNVVGEKKGGLELFCGLTSAVSVANFDILYMTKTAPYLVTCSLLNVLHSIFWFFFLQRFLIWSNILLREHIQPVNCILECLTGRTDLLSLVYLIVQRFVNINNINNMIYSTPAACVLIKWF